MNKGKQLEAQRFLNRLLILDPENDEVFELLQNMHTTAEIPVSQETSLWMYALPVIAIGALILLFKPEPTPTGRHHIGQRSTSGKGNDCTTHRTFNKQKRDRCHLDANPQTAKKAFPHSQSSQTSNVKYSIQAQKANVGSNTVTSDAVIEEPTSLVKQGMLTVSIPNAWAEIWIDDVKYGRTGQVKPISLTEGEHEVKLINPYSVPHVETVTISADQPTHIEIRSLKRKPATLIFASTLSQNVKLSSIKIRLVNSVS